jgi:hypothetical protein
MTGAPMRLVQRGTSAREAGELVESTGANQAENRPSELVLEDQPATADSCA